MARRLPRNDSLLGALTLEKVYNTEIVPAAYAPYRGQVLGAEAPLWTERVTPANAETLLYPRLVALAEIAWNAGKRDYPEFQLEYGIEAVLQEIHDANVERWAESGATA